MARKKFLIVWIVACNTPVDPLKVVQTLKKRSPKTFNLWSRVAQYANASFGRNLFPAKRYLNPRSLDSYTAGKCVDANKGFSASELLYGTGAALRKRKTGMSWNFQTRFVEFTGLYPNRGGGAFISAGDKSSTMLIMSCFTFQFSCFSNWSRYKVQSILKLSKAKSRDRSTSCIDDCSCPGLLLIFFPILVHG